MPPSLRGWKFFKLGDNAYEQAMKTLYTSHFATSKADVESAAAKVDKHTECCLWRNARLLQKQRSIFLSPLQICEGQTNIEHS